MQLNQNEKNKQVNLVKMQNEPHGVCLNSKGKNKKSLGNLPFICRQTFLKNENLITLMKK